MDDRTRSEGSGQEKSHNPREVILSEVPVVVQSINVSGLQRTKDDIVSKHICKLFAAKNFQEMIALSLFAKQQFERLNLFKSINIDIDINRGNNALADGYDVTYRVVEERRLTGSVSTLVGTNEGSLLFGLKLPNMFGRAERFSSDLTYGTKNALGWSLNYHKPIRGNPDLNFQAGIFQNNMEYRWSGYKQLDRGLYSEFTFPSLLGLHSIHWEGVWRDLSSLSKSTAFAVREQAGPGLKSSLRHTWHRDTRDSRVLPNYGYRTSITHEVAGLGGDARYFKQEAELQLNKSLFWDTVVQVTLGAGMIYPLVHGTQLSIMDRFFLGGPLTLRGFNLKGVGPHEDGCALGSDVYWLSGLHLYTPLPFRPGRGGFGDHFRTHFFINAGNLTSLNYCASWKQNFLSLADTLRWSYGAGIVLGFGGFARLELNYCIPVRAQTGDSISPGVQLGVGVSFS